MYPSLLSENENSRHIGTYTNNLLGRAWYEYGSPPFETLKCGMQVWIQREDISRNNTPRFLLVWILSEEPDNWGFVPIVWAFNSRRKIIHVFHGVERKFGTHIVREILSLCFNARSNWKRRSIIYSTQSLPLHDNLARYLQSTVQLRPLPVTNIDLPVQCRTPL